MNKLDDNNLKLIQDILDLIESKIDPYICDNYECAGLRNLMDEICEKYDIEKRED